MSFSRGLRLFTKTTLALASAGALLLVALTSMVVMGFGGTAQLQTTDGHTTLRAALSDVSAGKREADVGQGSGATVCALVFGAAVHRGALPGPGISRRVGTAARLYREGVLQHIILSGGKGGVGVASEAEVMRDVALQDGILAGDLTLEESARSTWENLLNSRPLTGSCSVIIGISDRYHLARIAYLAGRQGWEDIRTLPSDLEAPWYFEVKSIGREVAALLYYMLITHVYPIDEISQHDIPDTMEPDVLGLLITKSDHLVCQLIY
ncbi:MAG: YdcF family protein [Candidatus Peribacteraceae bacterium]|jgi:vancomycin permeability regulator SanA|nr:YdcF family protein [Candidatus Peribacteraceae bacterium]